MIPEKIYREFIEVGTAKAEAHYEYLQLDGQTKSILAAITLEAKEHCSSMAEAKDVALAASVYRDHVRAVAEARRKYDLAAVKMAATEALFGAQRTLEASERQALRAAP